VAGSIIGGTSFSREIRREKLLTGARTPAAADFFHGSFRPKLYAPNFCLARAFFWQRELTCNLCSPRGPLCVNRMARCGRNLGAWSWWAKGQPRGKKGGPKKALRAKTVDRGQMTRGERCPGPNLEGGFKNPWGAGRRNSHSAFSTVPTLGV